MNDPFLDQVIMRWRRELLAAEPPREVPLAQPEAVIRRGTNVELFSKPPVRKRPSDDGFIPALIDRPQPNFTLFPCPLFYYNRGVGPEHLVWQDFPPTIKLGDEVLNQVETGNRFDYAGSSHKIVATEAGWVLKTSGDVLIRTGMCLEGYLGLGCTTVHDSYEVDANPHSSDQHSPYQGQYPNNAIVTRTRGNVWENVSVDKYGVASLTYDSQVQTSPTDELPYPKWTAQAAFRRDPGPGDPPPASDGKVEGTFCTGAKSLYQGTPGYPNPQTPDNIWSSANDYQSEDPDTGVLKVISVIAAG